MHCHSCRNTVLFSSGKLLFLCKELTGCLFVLVYCHSVNAMRRQAPSPITVLNGKYLNSGFTQIRGISAVDRGGGMDMRHIRTLEFAQVGTVSNKSKVGFMENALAALSASHLQGEFDKLMRLLCQECISWLAFSELSIAAIIISLL